jgi:hypothetical protein
MILLYLGMIYSSLLSIKSLTRCRYYYDAGGSQNITILSMPQQGVLDEYPHQVTNTKKVTRNLQVCHEIETNITRPYLTGNWRLFK